MGSLVKTVDYSGFIVKYGRDKLTAGVLSSTETGATESVLPSEEEFGLDAVSSLAAVENTALVKSSVDAYPNLRNVSCAYIIGNVQRILSDATHPSYMWARVVPTIYCQILGLGSTSSRATQFAAWEALKADNPLFHGILHAVPSASFSSFNERTDIHEAYWYRVASWRHNRVDSCCMLNTNDAGTIFNNTEVVVAYTSSGASTFSPNFVTPAVRSDLAAVISDFLAGTNNSGFDFGKGYDFSDYMVWYFDATQLLFFGFNKKLMNPYPDGVGSVVSIGSYGSYNQLRSCTISTQPGEPVYDPNTGELLEQNSYNRSITFFPNNDPKGFITYRIDSLNHVANGRSDITLKALPGSASGVNQMSVNVGYRYTINNEGSTPDNVCDWNADGTPDNKYDGAKIWVPAYHDMWDQVNTLVLSETGHESGIGFNSGAASWDEKYRLGWPSPHEFTAGSDYCTFENASRDLGFTHVDETRDYDVRGSRKWQIAKTMHAMYFMKAHRRNPNSFIANKPYRTHWECLIVGNSYDLSLMDGSLLRFNKALTLTVGDMMCGGVLDSGNAAVGIEEDFIDLDTDYSYPEPIADYDDAAGGNGSSGYPVGLATMRTPTCGERIYVRRIGNWLVIINAADSDRSDYPDIYSPSHLPGGYTPQATNDEITAANWTSIISTYLNAGETLRHFNPATYVNARVTNYLRAANPSHWGSYNYGPRQPHPNDNDGTYTLANCPAFVRDDTLNDGSTVNTGASYFIGPMEAVFLEIV